MLQKVVVPNKIMYGIQNRSDTFTGKLGYMIYANKSDGTYGQQKSFDGWRDSKIKPKVIENKFQTGFVINKGRLNSYRYGASAKFRIFHPEGFEFEITLENLSLILAYTNTSAGEINVPCKIGWEGNYAYLIPEADLSAVMNIEEYDVDAVQEKANLRKEKRNNSGKPIPFRSLTNSKIVEDENGKRYFVFSPTQSNFKDGVNGYCLNVGQTEISFIPAISGSTYHRNFNNIYPLSKVFLPLFDENTVFDTKIEKKFYKFIERNQLTKDESDKLEIIKSNKNFLIDNGIKFDNIDINEKNILSLLFPYSGYGKTDHSCFATNKVVNYNGKTYLVFKETSYYMLSDFGMINEDFSEVKINNHSHYRFSAKMFNLVNIFDSKDNKYITLQFFTYDGEIVDENTVVPKDRHGKVIPELQEEFEKVRDYNKLLMNEMLNAFKKTDLNALEEKIKFRYIK